VHNNQQQEKKDKSFDLKICVKKKERKLVAKLKTDSVWLKHCSSINSRASGLLAGFGSWLGLSSHGRHHFTS
jgi:hypothetical protein